FQRRCALWKPSLKTASPRRRSAHVSSRRSRVISKKSPKSKLSRRMTKHLRQRLPSKNLTLSQSYRKPLKNFRRRCALWKPSLKTASSRRRRFAHVSSRRSRVISRKSPKSKLSRRMTKHLRQRLPSKNLKLSQSYRKPLKNFPKKCALWKPSLKTASPRRRRFAHVSS
ncbi:hypothetical protein KR074_010097, partial [Drosophila pseudoananassae]